MVCFFCNENFNYHKELKGLFDEHDVEILAERFPFSKGSFLGDVANKSCPKIVQLFVSSKTKNEEFFEAKLYKVKKFIDNNFHPE